MSARGASSSVSPNRVQKKIRYVITQHRFPPSIYIYIYIFFPTSSTNKIYPSRIRRSKQHLGNRERSESPAAAALMEKLKKLELKDGIMELAELAELQGDVNVTKIP